MLLPHLRHEIGGARQIQFPVQMGPRTAHQHYQPRRPPPPATANSRILSVRDNLKGTRGIKDFVDTGRIVGFRDGVSLFSDFRGADPLSMMPGERNGVDYSVARVRPAEKSGCQEADSWRDPLLMMTDTIDIIVGDGELTKWVGMKRDAHSLRRSG